MEFTVNYSENYLEHHGIKGQKWGIRRYQNYDGSYTQAGMKRYNESLSKYEEAKSKYESARLSGNGTEISSSRIAMNEAEKKLNKDYKHLKQDKLADKGKERYSRGETITGHANFTNILASGGSLAAGAQFLAKNGYINYKAANFITAGATIGVGASFVKQYLIDAPRDKQLRAYYSHTSKY